MSALGGISSGFGEGVEAGGAGVVVSGVPLMGGLHCPNVPIACGTVISRRIVTWATITAWVATCSCCS